MTFLHPQYLLLGLLLIPMVVWYVWKLRRSDASIMLSSDAMLKHLPQSKRLWLRHVPFVLRMLTIALLIVVFARPQQTDSWSQTNTEGIDIMIAMDVSGSMLAQDFTPNRIDAVKDIASEFILARPNDRIGMVLFAGKSFTLCPLTTDHTSLVNMMGDIKFGMIEDGTAIGLGIASSVNRLRNDSTTKSKVIILLTDGSNNRGSISPRDAAELARLYDIRVYTIGVGRHGMVRMPVQTPFGIQYAMAESDFDEEPLKAVAASTGGAYFHAQNNQALRQIYEQIDQMEKSKISTREYSKREELYEPFALLAALCLILEILIRHIVLKSVNN
ncbi:MAG: VWA domain-containing protein [Paludibacteraceae bacterium]|nr:VWA domain-containing protein [Paludibacteraceae bacterium]